MYRPSGGEAAQKSGRARLTVHGRVEAPRGDRCPGTPLRVSLAGGHRNDVTQLLPLVDEVPPVRGEQGRPRHKPRALYAVRGYVHGLHRRRLREHGITPKIARRWQPHGSGPGRIRRVAESAIAHLHGPCRLRIRWEARHDMHDAFLQLAHCTTLARRLPAL